MTTHAADAPWDLRRLVYGDWTWFIRDGLDVLRLAFGAGTIVFAVQGRSETVALTAAFAVLLVARIVSLPRWFDFGLIVAITLIAYGTALGLYGDWFYYDKVVHSIAPLGYSPVLYLAIVRLGVVPDPGVAIREHQVARISGIFILTLALGMSVGGFYECIEWLEDKWDILGGHFVKGLWDTETDLLCDASGSLAGAIFITVWGLRGWSSRRVTVVPVSEPDATPVQAAGERLSGAAPVVAVWRTRLGTLPLFAQAVVGIVTGALLLLLRTPTLRTVEIVLGIALLATAALEAVELVRTHPGHSRLGQAATAVAAAAAGVFVLAWPRISQLTVLYAVGASSVVLAFAEAAALATRRSLHDRALGAVVTVAALVFGIAMLAWPRGSLDAVITLLGVFLVVTGALRLLRGLVKLMPHLAQR